MYNRKSGLPIYVYVTILAIMLVAAYYIAGIFTYEDLSFDNYPDKINDVILHFYVPWKYYNEKTVPILEATFVAWILLTSYMMYYFRDFRPYKEHGTAEWGDIDDYLKHHSDPSLGTDRILSRDVRISIEGKNKPSNNNMMVIATAGGYKTTGVMVPNILRCASNIIVLDVKGDTLFLYGNYLEEQGYDISVLNLYCPTQSDGYNPMEYIENEMDVEDLINNIYESLEPPDAVKNDPFWTDGPKLYMSALFNYEYYMAKYENRIPKLNNVMQLLTDEQTPDETKEKNDKGYYPSVLEGKMKDLEKNKNNPYGKNHPACRDYRKLKEGAVETVRSIVIIVNAKLKLFNIDGINRVFDHDELNLREFAYGVGGNSEHMTDKKKALFICVDAFNTSYHFIASILYSQAVTILSRIALNEFKNRGSCLPIPLEFWMDEFYTGARPYNTVTLLGVIRSINMSMILFFQSYAQVKDLFQQDKTEIILDNCPTVTFGGCGPASKETAEWISELLNKETIDTFDDSKQNGNYNSSHGKTGIALMTPDEVMKMDIKDIIIFTQSEKPIRDKKAIPWEMPENVVPFQHAMELNKNHPDEGWINHIDVVEKDGKTYLFHRNKGFTRMMEVDPALIPEDAVRVDFNSDAFVYANLNQSLDSDMQKFYNTIIDLRADDTEASSDTSKQSNDIFFDENDISFDDSLDDWFAVFITRERDQLQLSEVFMAMSNGKVPEDAIKFMMTLPGNRSNLVRKAYENGNEEAILHIQKKIHAMRG